MNPFPQDRSVLILDNCAIHKSAALREVIEAKGQYNLLSTFVLTLVIIRMHITFSSTLFTGIEESFSAGETDNQLTFVYCLYQFEVKAWICRHWKRLANSDTPEIDLLEACGTVTEETSPILKPS